MYIYIYVPDTCAISSMYHAYTLYMFQTPALYLPCIMHLYTLCTCSRHLRYVFHVSCTCIHSVHVPDTCAISSMYHAPVYTLYMFQTPALYLPCIMHLYTLCTCSRHLRYIFHCLQAKVVQKWPTDGTVRTRAVSGFLFLRFICPALINPLHFNLLQSQSTHTHTHTHACMRIYICACIIIIIIYNIYTYIPCALYTVFVKYCIDQWNADTV